MSRVKREFTTKVRQPFQDAVATILHVIDYHNSFYDSPFHMEQARVLKRYLIDLKDWIVLEEVREAEKAAEVEREFNRRIREQAERDFKANEGWV